MPIDTKKICLISFYHDLDYVRITKSAELIADLKPDAFYHLKIQNTGLRSYFNLFLRLLKFRISNKVDYYYLNFRGTEVFFIIRIITLGKKLIYDSFVPFHQAFMRDNKWGLSKVVRVLFGWLVYLYEKLSLVLSHKVVTDTASHAALLQAQYGIKSAKLIPVYVGANDEIFKFQANQPKNSSSKLTILYYGNFLPLHGLDILFEALGIIKDPLQLKMIIIGKVENIEMKLSNLKEGVADLDIEYIPRLPLKELRDQVDIADVCIAGPLGNTSQAQHVITGKAFQFMAMGKTMIIGANKETQKFKFLDKVNCLKTRQGSPEHLANTIDWLVHNQSKLGDIGINARKLYDDHFTSDHLKQQILKAFD